MHDENDGPDVSDGYDHEGFIGGCERMRCPGYMKLQQENKRLRELLRIAKCPNISCTDGAIPNGEGKAEQCQWCDEREQALKDTNHDT